MVTQKQRKEAIQEFETMRDDAELKTLSKVSLERKLTNREHARYEELADKKFTRMKLKKVS